MFYCCCLTVCDNSLISMALFDVKKDRIRFHVCLFDFLCKR